MYEKYSLRGKYEILNALNKADKSCMKTTCMEDLIYTIKSEIRKDVKLKKHYSGNYQRIGRWYVGCFYNNRTEEEFEKFFVPDYHFNEEQKERHTKNLWRDYGAMVTSRIKFMETSKGTVIYIGEKLGEE